MLELVPEVRTCFWATEMFKGTEWFTGLPKIPPGKEGKVSETGCLFVIGVGRWWLWRRLCLGVVVSVRGLIGHPRGSVRGKHL